MQSSYNKINWCCGLHCTTFLRWFTASYYTVLNILLIHAVTNWWECKAACFSWDSMRLRHSHINWTYFMQPASLLISHYSAANLQNHSSIQVALCPSALQSVCCTRHYIRPPPPLQAIVKLHAHYSYLIIRLLVQFHCCYSKNYCTRLYTWRRSAKMLCSKILLQSICSRPSPMVCSDYNSLLCSEYEWSKAATFGLPSLLWHKSPHPYIISVFSPCDSVDHLQS